MILKEFIKKLEKIEREHGASAEVVMADNTIRNENRNRYTFEQK